MGYKSISFSLATNPSPNGEGLRVRLLKKCLTKRHWAINY